MRIIVVNRNYFVTGGPEKYLFTLMKMLKEFEFIPFAVDFPQNIETYYSRYFVSAPWERSITRFDRKKIGTIAKIRYAFQTIYSLEAKKKLLKLIDDAHPEIAFFLNATYFSQSIVDACKKRKVPIVWRVSDFNLICGNYLLFRDGHVCTDCIDFNMTQLLTNRCGGYQRSLSAAVIRFLAMRLGTLRSVYSYVSYFICPSLFTKRMLAKGGFPAEKLVHIPTFVKVPVKPPKFQGRGNQFLFVGRVTPEKGLDILLEAVAMLDSDKWKLVIVGDRNSDYSKTLKARIAESVRDRIHFEGFLSPEELEVRLLESLFIVVPSVWYENMPNVVLEAMAMGRPVVASRLGSLEEIVREGKTGLLFNPGDASDLAKKIEKMLYDTSKTRQMGEEAFSYVRKYHAPEVHLQRLKELFYSVV